MRRISFLIFTLFFSKSLNADPPCYNPVCEDLTQYVFYKWFSVPSGTHTIEFKTFNLAKPPFQTLPVDTTIWLVKATQGSAMGDVIKYDDDGNDETPCSNYDQNIPDCVDSKIKVTLTLTQTTYFMVIASSWLNGYNGWMDLHIKVDGQHVAGSPYNAVAFGGYHIVRQFYLDDRIFVGSRDFSYHDSVLYAFSHFHYSGGFVQINDDDIGLLSQILVGNFSSPNGHILVGTYSPDDEMFVRVFHSRKSVWWAPPSCNEDQQTKLADYQDCDNDGLTYEIENLIGSCDTKYGPGTDVGIEGYSCNQYYNTIGSGWSAKDSDNDGLKDKWEVYGVRKVCTQTPKYPTYNPGTCTENDVPESSGYEVALSTLGRPEVNKYDFFTEVDFMYDNNPQHSHTHAILDETQDIIKYTFEKEGLECPDSVSINYSVDCPDAMTYRIKKHVYNSEALLSKDTSYYIDNPFLHEGGGVGGAFGFFNMNFTNTRKYTNTFRYVVERHGGNGVTSGRIAMCGTSGGRWDNSDIRFPSAQALIFLHETSHQLGISGDNVWSPNWPSLTTSGYVSNMTKKLKARLQDGTPLDWGNYGIGTICDTDTDCNTKFCRYISGNQNNPTKICDLDYGNFTYFDENQFKARNIDNFRRYHGRLSRGINPLVYEVCVSDLYSPIQIGSCDNLYENWTKKMANEVFAYSKREYRECDGNENNETNRLPCMGMQGTQHYINWNRNVAGGQNVIDEYPYYYNIDGETQAVHEDHNDWVDIFKNGKGNLSTMYYGHYFIFQSVFQEVLYDLSAYGNHSYIYGNLSFVCTDIQEICDHPQDYPLRNFGLQFNGSGTTDYIYIPSSSTINSLDDFHVILRFKLESTQYPQQLIYSNYFEMWYSSSCSCLKAHIINYPETQVNTDPIFQTGIWYMVILIHSKSQKKLSIYKKTPGPERCFSTTYTTNIPHIDTGTIYVGYWPGNADWTFGGEIDEMHIYNASCCQDVCQ